MSLSPADNLHSKNRSWNRAWRAAGFWFGLAVCLRFCCLGPFLSLEEKEVLLSGFFSKDTKRGPSNTHGVHLLHMRSILFKIPPSDAGVKCISSLLSGETATISNDCYSDMLNTFADFISSPSRRSVPEAVGRKISDNEVHIRFSKQSPACKGSMRRRKVAYACLGGNKHMKYRPVYSLFTSHVNWAMFLFEQPLAFPCCIPQGVMQRRISPFSGPHSEQRRSSEMFNLVRQPC